MYIYKTKLGYVAQFVVENVRVNVVDNDRLIVIQMAIDYISNVKGK